MGLGSGAVENMVTTAYPQPAFWRHKKVFLTGHTGFKGSWLSLWLHALGAEVSGYALAPATEPNLFTLAGVAQKVDSYLGDVRDLAALTARITAAQPEIIFHLAAQPLVYEGYQYPVETYATNVMGTVHLLEAARHCPSVRVIVIVTSDKCYENQERAAGYREDEPMGGYDPYSNSKGCAELVTAAYRNSFFNPQQYTQHQKAVASVRAGNVIGGGDWSAHRLIPDVVTAFSERRPAIIRNPQAIRPWQHVLEPLAGYLLLAEKMWQAPGEFARAWNFGPLPEGMQPVQTVVAQLAEAWGSDAHWQVEKSNFPHEAQILKLDITRAVTQLGWRPRWTLAQTLHAVTDWYKAWENGDNIYTFSLDQIEAYQQATELSGVN